MKRIFASFLALGLVTGPIMAAPAAGQSRSEQGEARREMSAGNILQLRDIEARILPTCAGRNISARPTIRPRWPIA